MKRPLIFHLLWIHAVALVIGVLLLLNMPGKNGAPSPMRQLFARVEGGGKPHYPISGTKHSRMMDFLERHPELVSPPRGVADEENGFLLFRDFVKRSSTAVLKLEKNLQQMIEGEVAWDVALAKDYLELHRETLAELRRIGRLPMQSVAGLPPEDLVYFNTPAHKLCCDALAVSLAYHLRAGDLAAAHADFASIYGLAAHLDRHEYPNLFAKTAGMLIRLSANGVLANSLRHVAGGGDWSAWIETMVAEPKYGLEMARIYRGEAYTSMGGLILPLSLNRKEKNPIWDFTAFEDAYANRLQDIAACYEKNGNAITLASDLGKLETRWNAREKDLGGNAREMLDLTSYGLISWVKGVERTASKMALQLAALELLQREYEGGPIVSAEDPRLATLTAEPFSWLAFEFDPRTRRLSLAAGSMLEDKDAVELMPVAEIHADR